ncbi:hypothetical protein [Bdellovibrio sp. HCB2-146]|uniref:hypothetical protein n=1 Tax=Bdellovibrio sp. HCB2-146 TaxID=3394362 RepID=UPI0039BC6D85
MKTFSIVAVFLMTLATVNAFAAPTTIQMGNAVDRLKQINYSNYQLSIEYVVASAFTSDSNSKIFGTWKKCFTRTANVPYDPFAPYIYESFSESKRIDSSIVPAGNTFTLDEAAILDLLENLEQKLKQSTQGQCDIESSVRISFHAYIPERNGSARSFIYLTKKHGKLMVHFTQWGPDMSAAEEGREYLPNQTPIEIGFPY